VRLNETFEQYKEHIHFVCVYIREAHPTDGWQVVSNEEDDVLVPQPSSTAARAEVADVCALRLNLRMPMVIDDMNNSTDEAYCALPERLFVIDAAGKIAWRSELGPWGFDVETWRKELAQLI